MLIFVVHSIQISGTNNSHTMAIRLSPFHFFDINFSSARLPFEMEISANYAIY